MQKFLELSTEEQAVHKYWMEKAIEEAKKAEAIGEVPIGAVIVKDNQIISTGYNLREVDNMATAHAELIAIQRANQNLKAWRLEGTTLYVTLEPCPMCAGAIINSRISEVVYGAADPKAGCAGTLYNLLEDNLFNHNVSLISGVMAEETGQLLTQFFRKIRNSKKSKNSYAQKF